MNKKADTHLSVKVVMGLIVGAIGLLLLLGAYVKIIKPLLAKPTCDNYNIYLDNVVQDVNEVASSESLMKTEFVAFDKNCALHAFSKEQESFVTRPDFCYKVSCLCICYDKDCKKAKYCEQFDNVDVFKGDYEENNFNEQVYVRNAVLFTLDIATGKYESEKMYPQDVLIVNDSGIIRIVYNLPETQQNYTQIIQQRQDAQYQQKQMSEHLTKNIISVITPKNVSKIYYDKIETYSSFIINSNQKYPDIPVSLIKAQIMQESKGDPTAKSKAGAVGLMQFMPGTAKDYGLIVGSKDYRTDPEKNIDAGTHYMHDILSICQKKGIVGIETYMCALASYNYGPTNTAGAMTNTKCSSQEFLKYKPCLPSETQAYVDSIFAYAAWYEIHT